MKSQREITLEQLLFDAYIDMAYLWRHVDSDTPLSEIDRVKDPFRKIDRVLSGGVSFAGVDNAKIYTRKPIREKKGIFDWVRAWW